MKLEHIYRLKKTQIAEGNVLNADDLDAEYDNLVDAYNVLVDAINELIKRLN